MKDLVDILVYQASCDLDGDELVACCRLESRVRKVPLPGRFSVPRAWGTAYASRFARLVRQTSLPVELADVSAAEAQAAQLLDPVLTRECTGMRWSSAEQAWV